MIAPIRKYKFFLLSSLLAAYLAGTFQELLLEGLHLVSHLAQEVIVDHQEPFTFVHTHDDGQLHMHRHVILEKISDAFDQAADDAAPAEKGDKNVSSKKKNPERPYNIESIVFFDSALNTRPTGMDYAVLSTFPSVLTPPPKA